MTCTPRPHVASFTACLICISLLTVAGAHQEPPATDESQQKATKQQAPEKKEKETKGLGKLPWAKSPELDTPQTSELASAREMFKMFGVGDSEFDSFFDDTPFGDENEETLARILFRMPQVRLEDIERWQKSDPSSQALLDDPRANKGEFFWVYGVAESVTKTQLIPELARNFEYKNYYRVRVTLDDGGAAIICTRTIPSAWASKETLRERVSASALFLKAAKQEDGARELVFAAPRIAWTPNKTTGFKLPSGHQLLAGLGMDIGLLDDLKERNRKTIGARERECFYQIMSATRRMEPGQLNKSAPSADIGKLLQLPEEQHGKLMRFTGNAERVTRILVNDPDIRRRFGIDHYYQIDMFLPLGDQTVQLTRFKGDKEGPVYKNDFPAIVCVTRLPKELKDLNDKFQRGQSQSELLNERVAISGFFYKLWAYRAEFVESFGENQRQLAPMFIAPEPQLQPVQIGVSSESGMYVGAAFILALAVIWFTVWRASRKDTEFERAATDRRFGMKGKSLNDMDLPTNDGPDFSGLD